MSKGDFEWMTGFESSAFPQVGTDELEETQHYRWWASDLVRVREVGITLIRYGIPWHRVNPRPHEYDWRWTDQALDLMQALGLTPIVDLFHYGTPLWIDGGIMHPIFGELQGWYARAFAERYPHVVYYTPTNEPYICATFGAELAIWYPFLRGDRNAALAIKNVTEGVCRAMAEVRRVRPDALMMVPDTCEYFHAVEGAFQDEADFRTARRFLVHDLYQGRVDRGHSMWAYLVRHGISEAELDWFGEHPVRLDILGLDYYPHSEHQLRCGPDGERVDEPATLPLGFTELARQYSERYGGIVVRDRVAHALSANLDRPAVRLGRASFVVPSHRADGCGWWNRHLIRTGGSRFGKSAWTDARLHRQGPCRLAAPPEPASREGC